MTLSAGTRLGAYEIAGALGAGGMGEVYRATDRKLGRAVAVKVLPAEMARDPERLARFQREARVVAALNHPNIVTIHSVEEADGVHFLTMELVEGQALDRLIPDGGLPLEKIIEIGSTLAEALAAAHEKGIVHRDLKPANVMVTGDGRVKVLDFGLAKDVRGETAGDAATLTSAGHTQAGIVMGTPAFMSPEQVSGRVLDHRTDIFSLGIILHQMATGRRPFEGNSSAELTSAILRDTPPLVNEIRGELPGDLARIIRRCLEKDPRHRVQTARDVANEFRDLARQTPSRLSGRMPSALHAMPTPDAAASAQGTSRIKRRTTALAIFIGVLVIVSIGVGVYLKGSKSTGFDSIAVLPLENRSNDPDADYISDGITESINNSLARLPGLKITPHSVAFHYKGKTLDVRKVGDELRVEAVLAGSVAQRGDDLTVEVELDDVRNGRQLWGEQYNRKLADLLAVESDIAREVSQRLRSQLSGEDQRKLAKGSTENPEAYQLYLKGKFYTSKFTKDGFGKGLDFFNQAIAVDPNYGLAYDGLAYNYINQIDWFIPASEAVPKTKAAVEKALAINDSDADAHLSLAILEHWFAWDWAASEREFKRALELNPNSSEAHSFYAWFLAPMGRMDEALAEARRAQQVDPLSPFANFGMGAMMVFNREWDRAVEQLRTAKELDSTYWFTLCFLGRAYEAKGRLPEAIAEFQHALEVDKDNPEIRSALGHAYAISGKRAEAQEILDRLKDTSPNGYVSPYNVALLYAGLGEKDLAFNWLKRAYKERSYYLSTYLVTDSRLDNLRADARFTDLLRRVGFGEAK